MVCQSAAAWHCEQFDGWFIVFFLPALTSCIVTSHHQDENGILQPLIFSPGPIYFYLKIVIHRNQIFEVKRNTKILEILVASYDHSTKARPTLSLLSKFEGLTIPAATLLQPQRCLSPLGSCPGTWAKVSKSFQKAHCLSPDDCHTCCPPRVAHHLAQETIGVTFPTSCSCHCCAPCLGEAPQQVVEV